MNASAHLEGPAHSTVAPSQVFLDIVEEVNVLLNSRGEVLSSHVVGRLVMKALLTGMPDIKIGLNDKVEVREGATIGPSCCSVAESRHCGCT
jgi:Adaptor complexes medium subunit family